VKNALVTFFAFVGFGVIPILPFIVASMGDYHEGVFLASTILTGFSLCVLGLVKVMFTGKKVIVSVCETFVLGAFAAFVSWGIGHLLEGYAK
jgi:VIT1/CCC1 family predicted Fe2+/Mn2+ transporter